MSKKLSAPVLFFSALLLSTAYSARTGSGDPPARPSAGESIAGLEAGNLDFGVVDELGFPKERLLSIRNTGSAPIAINGWEFPAGSPFQVQSGLPATVQAGQAISIIIRFSDPGVQAAFADTLRFITSPAAPSCFALISGSKVFRTSITGPDSLLLNINICDETPMDTMFSISNPGVNDLIVTQITLSTDSNFSLTPPAVYPIVVPGGETRTVGIRFNPTSAGDKYATIRISSNAGNAPLLRIPAHGRKNTAELTALSLYFGTLTPDKLPAEGEVFIRNSGTTPIELDSAVFSVSHPFVVLSALPRVIAPHREDTLLIRFEDPDEDGYYSDTLAIAHTPSCRNMKVLVAGTRLSAPRISGPSTVVCADMFCRLGYIDTTIRISSTGAYTLRLSGWRRSGGDAFSITSAFPRDIPAGFSDTLTLRFAPAGAGFHASAITLENNAVNEPSFVINVFGTADNPRLEIPQADFGRLNPAEFPSVRRVRIFNPSLVPVTLDSIDIVPDGPFDVAASFPVTIPPRDSRSMDIIFEDPATDGTYKRSLIAFHRPRCATTPVELTGERFSKPLIEAPGAVDFDALLCPDESRDTVLRIYNPGGGATVIQSARITGDPSFSFAPAPPLPLTLPPEGEALLAVRFAPAGAGTLSAAVEIESNANNSPLTTIQLTGRKDSLNIVAGRADFGVLQPTQFPVETDIRIQNTGTVAATVTSANFGGSAPFTLLSPPPITLPPGGFAEVTVRFNLPPSDGFYTDTLVVETTPSCGQILAAASGAMNTRPEITGPAAVHFPALLCDGEAADTAITIRNTGGTDLQISVAAITGDPDFTIEPPFTPFAIPRGDSATISLRFSPASTGDRAGLLTLENSASGFAALAIQLRGRRERVDVSVRGPAFGNVLPGGFPVLGELVFRNDGTVPVTIGLPDAQASDPFTVIAGLPATVAPGDSVIAVTAFNDPGADGEYVRNIVFPQRPSCGDVPVEISGARLTPAAGIFIADGSAAPGEIVEIPVYLRNGRHIALSGATAFRLTLKYNRTLLRPMFEGLHSASGDQKSSVISLPAIAGDGLLALLRFEAALGNDTATALIPEHVESVGGPVALTAYGGYFHLDGICREGGLRLLDPDGRIALHPNTPNPFNPLTLIDYEVIETAHTRLSVVDRAGRTVTTLVDGTIAPGKYRAVFDGSALPSGIYLCVLQTESRTLARPMTLLK